MCSLNVFRFMFYPLTILSFILGSSQKKKKKKKEKKKGGENWSTTVPPLGEAEYCSCNKALTHSTLINS